MRSIQIAYREPALVLTDCMFGPCLSDSSICGSFEGLTASGEAVLCSYDSSEAV